MNQIILPTPELVSLAIGIGLGLYAWRRPAVPGARGYSLVAISEAGWMMGYIFELLSPDLASKIFWDNFQFIGAFGWPIAFLFFACDYTGRQAARPWRTYSWVSLPLITGIALAFTDPLHHLIRPRAWLVPGEPFAALLYDFTPVIWGITLYGYLIMLVGIFLLAAQYAYAPSLYRAQIGVILLGTLLPLLGTVLTLTGVIQTAQRDISPYTFALSNLIIAWGLFRYRLFGIALVARDILIENMPDAMFVLNAQGRIVDINPPASQLLGQSAATLIGQSAAQAFSRWPELIQPGAGPAQSELEIGAGAARKYVELKNQPLTDRAGRYLGRLLVWHDITRRRQMEAELRQAHDVLNLRVRQRTAELEQTNLELQAEIAERKQAEAALRESEERYRAVIENQTEFIVRWKANGLRTFVNDAYCRHFGLTPQQAISTSFLSLVAEEDQRAVEEKIARLNSGQVDAEIEVHRVINPDGSIGWQEWTDQAIRDESGNLIEFQSVGRDITKRKQAETALQRYTERLEILHEIDRAILAAHSLQETALAGLTRLRRLIPCLRAGAVLFDDQPRRVTSLAVDVIGPTAYTAGASLPLEGIADIVSALRRGQPIIVEDVLALPQRSDIYNRFLAEGVRSWLHAPLYYQGALIGALNFGAAEPGTFNAEHVEIAREVADQLAVALQQARLFEAKQRALSRVEILHEVDRAILSVQSPQATAQAALDKVRQLIGCLRASVSLFDFQTDENWLLAVSTSLPVRFPLNARSPLEEFGLEIVKRLQEKQPFVIEDVETWSGSSPAQQQLAADGIRSWLYAPLVYQGELIGSLNLGDAGAEAFDAEHTEIALQVAALLAIAVQQARLFEQVSAARDQLQALSHRLVDTQEAERRHIARELHDEIGQSLTGLKLTLQVISRLPPQAIPARVNDSLKLVNELMTRVHNLSLDLRPMMLDDLGLVAALLWLFEHYTAQTGVQVHSEFLRLENRLPTQVETTAYRIVQEALTNVARHAGVKEAQVRLLVEDSQLRLQVQDSGVGFNAPAALAAGERLGLASMKERAALLGGWLQVNSAPGLGAQVTAVLPVARKEAT